MRCLLFVVIAIPAIWIMILNWICFATTFLLRREWSPSWIPLASGCLLSVSLVILPGKQPILLLLLPLFLDWGCIPGLSHAAIFHAQRIRRDAG